MSAWGCFASKPHGLIFRDFFAIYFIAMRVRLGFLVLLLAAGRLVAQDANPSAAEQRVPRPEPNSPAPQDASPSGDRGDQAATPGSSDTTGTPCSAGGISEIIVTQDQVRGKLVHKVAPVYPEKARRAGVQGTVVMCAAIGKDGKIKSLKLFSGPQELVPAAMKAVKKWRYAPFQLNNQTVEVETDIRVNFNLSP
jgi:TonB family protein